MAQALNTTGQPSGDDEIINTWLGRHLRAEKRFIDVVRQRHDDEPQVLAAAVGAEPRVLSELKAHSDDLAQRIQALRRSAKGKTLSTSQLNIWQAMRHQTFGTPHPALFSPDSRPSRANGSNSRPAEPTLLASRAAWYRFMDSGLPQQLWQAEAMLWYVQGMCTAKKTNPVAHRGAQTCSEFIYAPAGGVGA